VRVLVWQWGRRGAGPRFAASLADGLRQIPGTEAFLSLSTGAEILQGAAPPCCELPFPTYHNAIGLAWRVAQVLLSGRQLARRLAALRLDMAICAMPGPLDLLLINALRRVGVPVIVVVHDADTHPGDTMPLLMMLQRRLTRRADAVVALSEHVAGRLGEQRLVNTNRLLVVQHPPFVFGPMPSPPLAHGGPVRLLCFGRLLQYKGLDLLASAMLQVAAPREWTLRVVGSGPESSDLASLRALTGVTVENRWVPEDEIGPLFAWADVLVLPYKEASQSGIAPAAIAAGRFVVSTRVGGLIEQLRNEHLATLCEPNAASLATVLRDVLDESHVKQARPAPVDPSLAWRDVAERLLDWSTCLAPSSPRAVGVARRSGAKHGWRGSLAESPPFAILTKAGRHNYPPPPLVGGGQGEGVRRQA
jgi:glycosyltransferase involved in cell wall biosynthesis